MPQCSYPKHSMCDTTRGSLNMRALMLRATTHTKPKRTMIGMRMQTQNVLLDSDAKVPAADWSDVSARLADFGTADVIASVQTLMTVRSSDAYAQGRRGLDLRDTQSDGGAEVTNKRR